MAMDHRSVDVEALQALQASSGPGAHQLGLFDDLAPAVDVNFSEVRHIDLDATSWIEHVPGWMTGGQRLLAELLGTAPWEHRDRWMYTRRVIEPRLTAEYPDIAAVPQVMLRTVAAALSAHYQVTYRSLWINLYRDNRDSTSWHGDVIGRLQEHCIVPVLSLGATRRFLIRPAEGGQSISLHPAAGDLIVMGGRCQRDWRHCVPKQTTTTGARISVNFSTGRT
jgi:alkylated DNA repair dioxygenase AlkB